jgi:Met-zincin/Domain of unknown function (DUF5117)
MRRLLLFAALVMLAAGPLVAAPQPSAADSAASIAAKTAGMRKLPGYFPLYWDAKTGKMWLEIDRWDTDFLYVDSLPAGVGSNDIGLDRGQLGQNRVVRFERSGPKVLLVEQNLRYRADAEDPAEREAVTESFAQSVLWGFEAAAQEGDGVLVDATAFFLHDAHDVAGTLKRTHQGSFHLDASRSAFYLDNTKNFPKNTEVEATLTFVGEDPGPWVRQVVPSPQAVTVREHTSFVELPGPGYFPRAWDPRSGYFGLTYADYSAPLGAPLEKRFIVRHRLEKKDPSAAVSDPVRPIVYYVDRGVPEPIRSALIEGASWWNQAFEAAGYHNAFRVELLPEGADPMDVRYNVIQWVHRATRGWSYGASVVDPRTGEIIQGHVTLGSLRIRQDFLIAQGLLSPYEKGEPVSPRMREMALARIRQLAAHEVGHTLGLAHNFAASTYGRASVMDYPPPLAEVRNGSIDLSRAYATGIGAWDKVAIDYGYRQFPPGTDENNALDGILEKAIARGMVFLSDQDARPPYAASPIAHLWDNGTDAVDELARVLALRKVALDHFSESAIPIGAPMATLEDVLVPVYLMHRYQVEAAATVLGGENYTYALRGDGQITAEVVAPAEQRRALRELLRTIEPGALALPERIIRLIPPRPMEYPRNRELFKIHTGLTFDSLAPAEAAANLTVGFILNPERDARLVEFHARNAKDPGLEEVIDRLLAATWKARRSPGYEAEVGRTVDGVVLCDLAALAGNDKAETQVRAVASEELDGLKSWASKAAAASADPAQRAHLLFAARQIAQWEQNPSLVKWTAPLELPDGPPIGMD